MHLTLGRRAAPVDVADLLLECHARIRYFTKLARKLGETTGLSDQEIREAAIAVRRFLSESLPLHVADEEQSLAPRLQGRRPEIDRALQLMSEEHAHHEPRIADLVALCARLGRAPDLHAALRGSLERTAGSLESDLAAHLAREEEILIPAIRELLDDADREAMLRELRARRQPGVPPGSASTPTAPGPLISSAPFPPR